MSAQPTGQPRRGTALEAVRAFGVMSGGPVVLLLLTLTSLWITGRALITGDQPPWPSIVVIAAFGVYLAGFRPWSRRWGATREELHEPLPGDELVGRPGIRMTRAVTIDAPVEAVWPWIVQIGQDRGAFYSYAWLENLAGCHLRNADRVHPEWHFHHGAQDAARYQVARRARHGSATNDAMTSMSVV